MAAWNIPGTVQLKESNTIDAEEGLSQIAGMERLWCSRGCTLERHVSMRKQANTRDILGRSVVYCVSLVAGRYMYSLYVARGVFTNRA